MTTIKVLIVDDHPLISQSFVLALNKVESDSSEYEFEITETNTLDDANHLISNVSNIVFDLVFLDIKLPPSKDQKLLSGEDLGIKIRELHPHTKIIISTTYNDNYRINVLLKSINPEGFLVKNDLTPNFLIFAIKEVLSGVPSYSKTIKLYLKKMIDNDFQIDQIDRSILFHLSIGRRMNELPNHIPMSLAGIEKRKRQLKDKFGVDGRDDTTMIELAKELGFI